MKKYSLMIHGGAGAVADKQYSLASIKKVLEVGEEMLKAGSLSVDVAARCVALLEDDPQFNAGKGSVLNENGQVEMDAGIMNGADLKAGAVAGAKSIKNPINLAKLVMEKSEHVFLIGQGAMEFARLNSVEIESDDYFITESRLKQLEEAKKQDRVVLDHGSISNEKKFGTVGAVAMDKMGNLAAATSTGGIVNKKFGRVGDTPIIGAGVYADNETCAVSCTGFGEQFIRVVMAKTISDIVKYQHVDAQVAADKGIAELVKKVKGLGGVIVIDKEGNCGSAFSTPGMIHGSVRESGEVVCRLQ